MSMNPLEGENPIKKVIPVNEIVEQKFLVDIEVNPMQVLVNELEILIQENPELYAVIASRARLSESVFEKEEFLEGTLCGLNMIRKQAEFSGMGMKKLSIEEAVGFLDTVKEKAKIKKTFEKTIVDDMELLREIDPNYWEAVIKMGRYRVLGNYFYEGALTIHNIFNFAETSSP